MRSLPPLPPFFLPPSSLSLRRRGNWIVWGNIRSLLRNQSPVADIKGQRACNTTAAACTFTSCLTSAGDRPFGRFFRPLIFSDRFAPRRLRKSAVLSRETKREGEETRSRLSLITFVSSTFALKTTERQRDREWEGRSLHTALAFMRGTFDEDPTT